MTPLINLGECNDRSVSAFALASTAFSGIKKAIEVGKEVEEVYTQLRTWAGHVSDLQDMIHQQENKKPGLFEKIGFQKSETAEAFDVYIAKQKLIEWEKEIFHEFCYGALCHLGRDGYNEFRAIRREIREKRQNMILDQMRRRKDFIHSVKLYAIIGIVLVVGISLLWFLIDLIYTMGVSSGKW